MTWKEMIEQLERENDRTERLCDALEEHGIPMMRAAQRRVDELIIEELLKSDVK